MKVIAQLTFLFMTVALAACQGPMPSYSAHSSYMSYSAGGYGNVYNGEPNAYTINETTEGEMRNIR